MGGATLWRDEKEARGAAETRAEAVRTEEDVFAVGRPAENDVVRGVKRESLGLAAFGGDNIYVRVAVVFAGEGDPLAVGRKFGEELVADVRGQAAGGAAFARGDPQVAGVGEDDLVFGYVRESEKAGRAGGHLVRGRGRLGFSRARCDAYDRGDGQPQQCVQTIRVAIHSWLP